MADDCSQGSNSPSLLASGLSAALSGSACSPLKHARQGKQRHAGLAETVMLTRQSRPTVKSVTLWLCVTAVAAKPTVFKAAMTTALSLTACPAPHGRVLRLCVDQTNRLQRKFAAVTCCYCLRSRADASYVPCCTKCSVRKTPTRNPVLHLILHAATL